VENYKNSYRKYRLIFSHSLENARKLYSLLDFRYSPKKKQKFWKALEEFYNAEKSTSGSKYYTLQKLIWKKSINIVEETVDETYNITTETGNLIINGILVKNSGGLETPPHQRVVPGLIHKAHKGVLFIDEIGTLPLDVQYELLVAMQEKKYPIFGRDERSGGSIVRTTPAPCDFILVAAGTPETIKKVHPALRSRIRGYGYEVYMESEMKDTPENRLKLAQFVAQEVWRDGKIPHFTREAVEEIIKEAQRRAGRAGYLTLKLRDLGGIVRLAGDLAKAEGSRYVKPEHVKKAIELGSTLEEQYARKLIEIKKEYSIIKTSGWEIGRVNGLGVIGNKGVVIPIEANVVPGSGKIHATGNLGKIAKEAITNVSAVVKEKFGKDVDVIALWKRMNPKLLSRIKKDAIYV